jgi:hypothetical protein
VTDEEVAHFVKVMAAFKPRDPNAPYIPSTQWQRVPDGVIAPSGGEYRVYKKCGTGPQWEKVPDVVFGSGPGVIVEARWDNPPGPETVIDNRPKKPSGTPPTDETPPEEGFDGRNEAGANSSNHSGDDTEKEQTDAELPPRIMIEILQPSQILAYKPPADLVLVGDYHLVRGTVVVVGGSPGVGKSRSTLALAEAGATQYEWFGLRVHIQFKTLIIQNENGLFRLQREIEAIGEPLLEDYLRVCPPPPYGMCFWKKEFRDQLKRAADYFGPHVVVLDPWNAIARDDRAKDYLESFEIIRNVFPQGESGPVLVIAAHTRKPTVGERANGRALLNLLAGSYVLGSVPRVVFVMQHASDEVTEERIVWTCCKNNDGKDLQRSAWVRQNGLFVPVLDFDWTGWDEGGKEGVFTLKDVVKILEKNPQGLRQRNLAKEIIDRGVPRTAAYRRIEEAENAGLIKFQKGKGIYVISE